jgi:hypothetical protein
MLRPLFSSMALFVLVILAMMLAVMGLTQMREGGMVIRYGQFLPSHDTVFFVYVDVQRNLFSQTGGVIDQVAFEESNVSPDGQTVVTLQNGGSVDLFMVEPGRKTRQITDFRDFMDARGERETRRANLLPVWSPDGEWIAFISNDLNGRLYLYIIRPDGSDLRQLGTHIPYPIVPKPQWVGLR